MYYLRTKSAVDAIKFTLDTKSKAQIEKDKEVTKSEVVVPATTAAVAPQTNEPVEPLSPQELKQMLSQAKDNEDDDCLMCGS